MSVRMRKNSSVDGKETKLEKLTLATLPASITFQGAMKACNRKKADIYIAIMKGELNWMAHELIAQKLIVNDSKYEAYKKKCKEADKRKAEKKAAKAVAE